MAGILAIALVFGMILAVVGCKEEEESNPFIGTWRSDDFAIVFTDGSFTITSPNGSVESGIYSWLPGDTTITMNVSGTNGGFYTASISGNTLTVGNRTYTKS